jgi:hypothetical protein
VGRLYERMGVAYVKEMIKIESIPMVNPTATETRFDLLDKDTRNGQHASKLTRRLLTGPQDQSIHD